VKVEEYALSPGMGKSCFILALFFLCTSSCAIKRANSAARSAKASCPGMGDLAVLYSVDDGPPSRLAGQPQSSPEYVALGFKQPSRRVALSVKSWEKTQDLFYSVDPFLGPHPQTRSSRMITIYLGPYSEAPTHLSVKCEQYWCRGGLQAITPDAWQRGLTISWDGVPWIELYLRGDSHGPQINAELRAAPPCTTAMPIATGSVP